jgi:hypothetical protein
MFVNESLLLEFAIARQGRHHPHGKSEDKQKMNQQNKNKQTTVNEHHIQTFLYFGIEMLCNFLPKCDFEKCQVQFLYRKKQFT